MPAGLAQGFCTHTRRCDIRMQESNSNKWPQFHLKEVSSGYACVRDQGSLDYVAVAMQLCDGLYWMHSRMKLTTWALHELFHTSCSVRTFADLLEATEGFRSVPMATAAPTPAALAASMEPPRPFALVCMMHTRIPMRTDMTVSYHSLSTSASLLGSVRVIRLSCI